MSLSYSLFKLVFKLTRLNSRQTQSFEKKIDSISRANEKIKLRKPKKTKLEFEKCITENSALYLYGRHKTEFSGNEKAVSDHANNSNSNERKLLIAIHGGGFLTKLFQFELNYGFSVGEESGCDVVVTDLPSCIFSTIDDVYEALSSIYIDMLSKYNSKNIAILGFSSGAALSIGICIHLRENYPGIELPRLIIASSPGSVPMLDEEVNKMWELEEKDIMLSTNLMINLEDVLKKDKNVPDYMLYTAHADFNSLPPIHFYYGTDEILLAQMPYYKSSCEKAGVQASYTIKEGMCHCYPGLPFKEGIHGKKEIISLLIETFNKY